MAHQFILSGFSDEIDSRIEKQFEHLNKLGIACFEPRGINGKNISDLTDSEVEELKACMKQYGIKVSSVGSPLGKIKITDDFNPHVEKLKRVIEIAKMLDTNYIRIFSFFIPNGEDAGKYRDEVMDRLEKMVGIAEDEAVILLHENEKDIYGDTVERCVDIFESIQSPSLRAVFDPANFIQCGQKIYPDAFHRLKPYISYMHIKDAKADGTVVPAGYGEAGFAEIIKELAAAGYQGFLSLEPHLGSFQGLADLELDDKMLKLEESGPDKFTMAYQALKNIIDEVEK